jgi:hypothetical protein
MLCLILEKQRVTTHKTRDFYTVPSPSPHRLCNKEKRKKQCFESSILFLMILDKDLIAIIFAKIKFLNTSYQLYFTSNLHIHI